jgi:2-oxoglutarate ferredoxin oxidoreductase subunit beta
MATIEDYEGLTSAWCPACGNFGILNAVKKALVGLRLEPHQVLMCSGIGQAGKLPHYLKCNVFNSLHGRPLAPAVAAKIVNMELNVIAVSGDGDAYGEGGNHFLHTMRRNHDITYLVHDNQIYGLTKGQASPTSDYGFVTKSTPYGSSNPINPIVMAIVGGATFVARGFAGDIEQLSNLIKQAVWHNGFALIDILQPCVSFNKKNTYQWYWDRIYKVEEENGYDPGDKTAAISMAQQWGEHIPTGVIYKVEQPTFEERLTTLQRGVLVKQSTAPETAKVEKLIDQFL